MVLRVVFCSERPKSRPVTMWCLLGDRRIDHLTNGPEGRVISVLLSQSRWRTTEQTCSTLPRGFGSNWGSRRNGSVARGGGSVPRRRIRGACGFRTRSGEHKSEIKDIMGNTSAVLCLEKKKT